MKKLINLFVYALLSSIECFSQWSAIHTFQNSNWIWQPFPVDENIVWGEIDFNNGNGGFFKTSDGGMNWIVDTLIDVDYTTSIYALDANTAYYTTGSPSNVSRILSTTDGGLSWVNQSSGFNNNNFINFIHFFDNNNGVVLGEPSGGYLEIYTTSNSGENWIRVPNANIPVSITNELPIYRAQCILSNTTWVPAAVIGTNEFRIFKSTDMGSSWTVFPKFTTSEINLLPTSLAFHSQTEGLLVLSKFNVANPEFKMMKTTDGGINWIEINFTLPINPAFVSLIEGTSSGYVVTSPLINFGSAYSLDGGNNWQLIENTLDLCLPRFTSPTSGWAVRWTFDASSIYMYSGPPLPVELKSFVAQGENSNVILEWITATELNNKGFEIQRRATESDFSTIGFVKGEGTTTNQREYSYIDKDLADGKYYYRLKQVDYNGAFEYSDIIEVEVLSIEEYALEQNFPNPFNPTTTIGYVLKEKTNAKLILLNAIGEEVAVLVNEEQDKGFHKIDFNASTLASGVYFYKLQASDFVQTRKMILLK